MSHSRGVTLASVALLFVVGSASAAPLRNAFLPHPARSTAELLREVEGSSFVMDRYERHFSMNRAQVIHYLSSLHYAKLGARESYPIYSVPGSGAIKCHAERLPKGEPVFENAAGRPILRAICGNPLTLGPSPLHAPKTRVVMSTVPITRTEELADTTPADTTFAVAAPIPPLTIDSSVGPNVGDLLNADTGLPPTFGAAPIPIAPLGPTLGTPGLGGLGAILPALGGLGLLVGGNSGGHGSPSVVPEPITFLPFGIGLLGLLARRRTRR